jgi:hypothetical protein
MRPTARRARSSDERRSGRLRAAAQPPTLHRRTDDGRRAFGRIAIANADSGAGAFVNVAIDQAERAVQECLASRGLI